MRRLVSCIAVLLCFCFGANAQTAVTAAKLRPATDSIAVLMRNRTTVENKLVLKKVLRRGNILDLYFTNSLGDWPWRKEDVEWFRTTYKSLLPKDCTSFELGRILSKDTPLEELPTPAISFKGNPMPYDYTYSDRSDKRPFVQRSGAQKYPKGMSGRNIALWQSHGRFFDDKTGMWRWQRPVMHRTVEDMYTQSFVLPLLIPMLENAGAYVITPRERDPQKYEIIIDNDPSFDGERPLPMRQKGQYSETGEWNDAGTGFADLKPVYLIDENPFTTGTARKAQCGGNSATWSFDVPEKGDYAVYVSYISIPGSTRAAKYTVSHRGGKTTFTVNQKMGGGTWIYLGTFCFEDSGSVKLEGGEESGVITADAVKIGGGMGKVARGRKEDDPADYKTSGMASYAEGALYSLQWAGIDTLVTGAWEGDYTRDFASRGAWVRNMAGGSSALPDSAGRRIPIDLSLGFHSDAGITPNDSTIGTLAIYTLLCEKSMQLPDGRNRAVGRHYADLVQSQVCNDIRAQYDTSWRRRWVWDRSYSESRTTGVPGLLLEVLSHQNFADMREGLDPAFRFTVSRAVYKGMLKFLADMYNTSYVVQPLPVSAPAVQLGPAGNEARISWKETPDPIEPTARAKGYILQTRMDDGVFDEGRIIQSPESEAGRYSTSVIVEPGHIYSFRIIAFNDGGRSFPSAVMSTGIPSSCRTGKVTIVDNFDRISAPAWFDTPAYAGFDGGMDSGVPYIKDISYVGDDYEHRREFKYETDANPGFGASRDNMAGSIIPGNTFDFTYVHGKALFDAGIAFQSVSRDAWNGALDGSMAVDIICGKQVTTRIAGGNMPDRYQVFPERLRKAVCEYTSKGGGIIISGAYIGTDAWSAVYPVEMSGAEREQTRQFIEKVLGYSFASIKGSYNACVCPIRNKALDMQKKIGDFSYWNVFNDKVYCVESANALNCTGKHSTVFLNYADSQLGAAVCYSPGTYKVVSFGFPLETVKRPEDLRILLENAVAFIKKK